MSRLTMSKLELGQSIALKRRAVVLKSQRAATLCLWFRMEHRMHVFDFSKRFENPNHTSEGGDSGAAAAGTVREQPAREVRNV